MYHVLVCRGVVADTDRTKPEDREHEDGDHAGGDERRGVPARAMSNSVGSAWIAVNGYALVVSR